MLPSSQPGTRQLNPVTGGIAFSRAVPALPRNVHEVGMAVDRSAADAAPRVDFDRGSPLLQEAVAVTFNLQVGALYMWHSPVRIRKPV